MAQEEQNRSEAPTHFKLEKARQKGQVARGLDLSFLTGLVGFLGFVWIEGSDLVRGLTQAMRDALIMSAQLSDDRGSIFAITKMLVSSIERPLAILLIMIFTIVFLSELVQTGIIFSSAPLSLDFSRINPAQGLKRLFSVRLLMETGKNVLKLGVYAAIAYLIVRGFLNNNIAAITDAASVARIGSHLVVRLLLAFAAAALIFAILDQIVSRKGFVKRMRMSRREVKQEMRDRDGDPKLKQKRKQMHGEFARTNQSLKGLRGADMLIVNPEHIAIALKYDAKIMAAPIIASVGVDRVALRLKSLALVYGIAVIEDRELARALFKGAAPGRGISPAQYRPVADQYNRLRRGRERKS